MSWSTSPAAQRQPIDSGKSPSELLELVQDVPTRWTSAYDMIKHLLLLTDTVHTMLSNSDKWHVQDLDLSAERLFQLQELNSVLELLCNAMQDMGGENYSSVSVVTPLLHKLLAKSLTFLETDTTVMKNCTKFNQLILSKIIKIVGTSCHISRLKCTKFDFVSTPDPAGGAYSTPLDTLAGFKGHYF